MMPVPAKADIAQGTPEAVANVKWRSAGQCLARMLERAG